MTALNDLIFRAKKVSFLRMLCDFFTTYGYNAILSFFFPAPSMLAFARISNHTNPVGNVLGVKRYSNIPHEKETRQCRGGKKALENPRRILLPLYDARRTPERRRFAETAAVNLRLVIERC